MARVRQIKPEFFVDEDVVQLSPLARLLFIGMWTVADRDGRFEDKPNRLRMQLLPADQVNAEALVAEIAKPRDGRPPLIVRYEVNGMRLIQIRGFKRHQRPHPHEAASQLPEPPAAAPNPNDSDVIAPTTIGLLTTTNVTASTTNGVNVRRIPDPEYRIPDPGLSDPEIETPLTPQRGEAVSIPKPPPADFLAWYEAYPRKVAHAKALKAWKATAKTRPPLAEMLAALEWQRRSEAWTKDGGEFIPYPSSYLNAGRWADQPTTGARSPPPRDIRVGQAPPAPHSAFAGEQKI